MYIIHFIIHNNIFKILCKLKLLIEDIIYLSYEPNHIVSQYLH